MRKKLLLSVFVFLCFLSCKETTHYQIFIYNDTYEQVKVKAYSSLTLKKDSFTINSQSQYEIFFKEEEGTSNNYDCSKQLDSVLFFSATKKMKVKLNRSWESDSETKNKHTRHRCLLKLSVHDTVK